MKRTTTGRGTRVLAAVLCLLLTLGLFPGMAVTAAAAGTGFVYQHDPRLNPKAMEDIQVDPTAPYGFSPSLTGSLREYAVNFDWSDPAAVELGRQERITYHRSLRTMYDTLVEMKAAGRTTEEIARTVSGQRNQLRMDAYVNDPEGLATMKARNLETYGREEGPTPEQMYEKYGSWETVIEKAFSVNLGMDVCLGLYDDNYAYYLAMELLPDEGTQTATREYAVSAFVRVLGGLEAEGADRALSAFSDREEITVWFQPEMAQAAAAGVVKGFDDGTLRPGQGIRRVEAFLLLSRCLPDLEAGREAVVFQDVPAWARKDIDRLSSAGLVQGYGNGKLGSQDLLTVEQVGILVERLAELQPAA